MRVTEHPDAGMAPDGTSRRPGRPGGAAAAMLLAVVLVGAACGGSTKTAAVASTTTTTIAATRAAQTQAFIQCMQQHGVPITSTRGLGGGGGGGAGTGDTGTTRSVPSTTLPPGVSPQQYAAALQACRGLLPTRGANPQNSAAAQAYRNCVNLQLQQAGVTTLPPVGQGGGGGGGGFGQPGSATTVPNPALQAARAHCISLLPPGGFGRGGATTTTPTT